MIATDARNATLDDLATLLKEQHARKLDVVAPASAIRSVDGVLVVKGAESVLSDDGVTLTDGRYRPTRVCDEGIAAKLNMPLPYVRRMRAERPDLYDANVNGWLHGRREKQRLIYGQPEYETVHEATPGDPRKFLVRCFRGDEEQEGIGRAFLSDQFKIVDNLDVLTAAMDGVREAGLDVEIDGCDLTERRMWVRIVAPTVRALAPVLLRNYRNPFADPDVERAQNRGWTLEGARDAAAREGLAFGEEEGGEPVVFGGFVIGNSETGNGRFSITPRMLLKVCKNGLVITVDAIQRMHLGAKMDAGVVRWSDDTQAANLALVRKQTRDAVATFLDVDYVTATLEKIEEQAVGRVSDPDATVKQIGKRLSFSEEETNGVLAHFIRGGQMTAGGMMNAVTSYAQTVDNADAAMGLEEQALRVLELAAAGS